MRRHWSYLTYVLRHKWFVLLASRRVACSLWLALIHDASKFRPSEWKPYAATFYAPNGDKQYIETPAFAQAWNLHQKCNPHHWQYWLLTWDRGETVALPMPQRYIVEMVADWMGAGRVITGKWGCSEWYQKNKDRMILHPDTRQAVEGLLLWTRAVGGGAPEAKTVEM